MSVEMVEATVTAVRELCRSWEIGIKSTEKPCVRHP